MNTVSLLYCPESFSLAGFSEPSCWPVRLCCRSLLPLLIHQFLELNQSHDQRREVHQYSAAQMVDGYGYISYTGSYPGAFSKPNASRKDCLCRWISHNPFKLPCRSGLCSRLPWVAAGMDLENAIVDFPSIPIRKWLSTP